jgi:short-subunit dehydrogenase
VRESGQVSELSRAARQWLGHTDLLVNNAGVAVAGPVEEVSLEDWRWIMDINLWGVIYGCRAFVPEMKQRARGYVVNVASAAGLISLPEMAPYNVTKAAVVALSETMHAELRPAGVHVSVLCPTFFKTNIHTNGRGVIDDRRRAVIGKLMERSRLQAPDVAKLALDAVARNHLYAVPMSDGRAMWRLKRLAPAGFSRLLGSATLRRRLDPR